MALLDNAPVVTITNGGSGYTSAPTVTFSGGGAGVTAQATGIALISGGVVTGIELTSIGAGIPRPPRLRGEREGGGER